MEILIVGAGIIGASLAFHAARAGADVTVIEAARPAAAASGRSFGWINASYFLNPAHHDLRVAAIAAHHRLHALLPDAPYAWQGTLWFEDEGDGFDRMQGDLTALGYPNHSLTPTQIAAREPALVTLPRRALMFPGEGATDAAALTLGLLAASGAKVLSGIAAASLIETDGMFAGVRTAAGPLTADHTILAAGVGTNRLLQTFGIDFNMLPRPGLILRTHPVGFRLNHILVSPEQEIRQLSDGSLLAPCAAHHKAETIDVAPDPTAARDATLSNLRRLFGNVSAAETLLGHRPMPADGLPALGLVVQGLSIAVMHSGVTLAPLAAEALVAEIMGNGTHPQWAKYLPERLLHRRSWRQK